jgi:hypothetical protein
MLACFAFVFGVAGGFDNELQRGYGEFLLAVIAFAFAIYSLLILIRHQ